MYHDHDMLEATPGPFWFLYMHVSFARDLCPLPSIWTTFNKGLLAERKMRATTRCLKDGGTYGKFYTLTDWQKTTSGFAGPSNTMANLPLDGHPNEPDTSCRSRWSNFCLVSWVFKPHQTSRTPLSISLQLKWSPSRYIMLHMEVHCSKIIVSIRWSEMSVNFKAWNSQRAPCLWIFGVVVLKVIRRSNDIFAPQIKVAKSSLGVWEMWNSITINHICDV